MSPSRLLPIGVLAAVALTGCASTPGTDRSVAASCNVARIQIASIASMVNQETVSNGGAEDQQFDLVLAEHITQAADRLNDSLTDPEAAAAFADVRTSLLAYADAVVAEPSSAADIDAARHAAESAGADLTALCAAPAVSSPNTASTAKVQIGPPPATSRVPFAADGDTEGDNATDFVPAIEVGETREGDIFDQDSGQPGWWTLSLERSRPSFWSVASWGRDYVLTFDTDTMGWFRFRDASGDEYSLWVHTTAEPHTLYFNSTAPEITGLTQTS